MLEQKAISNKNIRDKKIDHQTFDFMRKVAIIGSPGAGKTTLAKNMNKILNIKVYHLDRLLWKTRWQSIDGPTRIDTMQSIIREKQWIIEGTYLYSSIPRLKEADTIIFLDTSFPVCLLRVINRHFRERGRSRRDIPMESSDKLTMRRMLKILFFPFTGRKILIHTLYKYGPKNIIRLRSPEEVECFLRQLKLDAYEKRNSSHIDNTGERSIVAATQR